MKYRICEGLILSDLITLLRLFIKDLPVHWITWIEIKVFWIKSKISLEEKSKKFWGKHFLVLCAWRLPFVAEGYQPTAGAHIPQ